MLQLLRRILFCVPILFLATTARAQQFVVDTLVSYPNIASPACISFPPDNSGRFLFTEKNNGRVRVVERGMLRPTSFATVPVVAKGEQGLLGVTHHPAYPDSPFVYILYTRSPDAANVVVRYRDSAGLGIRPVVLLVSPQTASTHIGGNIHFGPDDKLYVTLGDNGVGENAQDTSVTNLSGKILRLNYDGSIPRDNPWPGKPFWSIGHANSFDFAFDVASGAMLCTENGTPCNDELTLVPAGGNLGWPFDSNCQRLDNAEYVRPIYVRSGFTLPGFTGIAVYRAGAFPRLRGHILFAGHANPTLWTGAIPAPGDTIAEESISPLFTYGSGFTDVEADHEGNIYLTGGQSASSRILRLRPVAPTFTSSPLQMATQGIRYSYTPTFAGTPPALRLVSAPEGMLIDTTTWSVVWVPTNEQAMQKVHTVMLRGENGAGDADQRFTITVGNVNDPPGSFMLGTPQADTTLSFVGNDPVVNFAWQASVDPDRDTLRYTLEIDTVATFTSRALRHAAAGTETALMFSLPRLSAHYFWRVVASDGEFTLPSSDHRVVSVSYLTPMTEERPLEGEFDLKQNFPNPFNPATNIVYTLPRRTYIRLAVFNLLGQEVALIHEGMQEAGIHEVAFRNHELPSGIYFYRIQSPDYVETKKLTILR